MNKKDLNDEDPLSRKSGLDALHQLAGNKIFSDPLFNILSGEEQEYLRKLSKSNNLDDNELKVKEKNAKNAPIQGILGIVFFIGVFFYFVLP